MFIEQLSNAGALPSLELTMRFAAQRQRVIAHNIANVSTPGYRAKHLDPRAFQESLKDALDARKADRSKPFAIAGNGQAETGDSGFLEVTPSELPPQNVLFHDGTNTSIEREMADLAETGMAHELAAALLRGNFDGLRKAIRGTV